MRARAAAAAGLGATILALAAAGDLHAQAGSISGVVFDSINETPLHDAAVFLWETPYRAVSDEQGRFGIDGVPPGDYSILFFHTQLGEMGISPGPRPVSVAAGETTEVQLGTPSMATVVSSQCLMEEHPTHTGIVAGWVRDGESDVRLAGSLVTLSWTVPDADAPEQLTMRTGAGGWYHTCAAPADIPLLAAASFYGREGLRREVTVAENGFTEAAFTLHALRGSSVEGRLVDAATREPVEGAEVWLRGTSRRTLTNGRGAFDLGDVAAGTYMLVTDHLAYGIKMDTLEVPGGSRISVRMELDTRPLEIAPVTVTVEALEPISAGMAGGIRITREQIDEVRQRSRDASDIIRSLHLPGVVVRHRSNGTICVGYISAQVKMNQTGCVEMLIYINDVRATSPDLALRLPPEAIERMTIYKPLEAGNLFGLGGGNGVWMIYTRGN